MISISHWGLFQAPTLDPAHVWMVRGSGRTGARMSFDPIEWPDEEALEGAIRWAMSVAGLGLMALGVYLLLS